MMDQRRISELSFDTRITQIVFPQRSIDSENVQVQKLLEEIAVYLSKLVDLRLVRPMSCVERQELCNNSSSANQVLAVVTDTDNTGKDKHYPLHAQFISTLVPNKESAFGNIKPAKFHPFRTRRERANKAGNLLWSVPISRQRSPIVPARSPSVTQSDALKRSLFIPPVIGCCPFFPVFRRDE
ncbi:hypothetical protein CEXT_507981 [Caerostris extrusa]|uniref:Uncharacterized protein n=1 Tax=Caerostris extrusa TaxID=172846 RepID=A0AAV4XXQ6_CAEEX|nr:hypothetical protein CEXT_507981 [Caerostris extrusa]